MKTVNYISCPTANPLTPEQLKEQPPEFDNKTFLVIRKKAYKKFIKKMCKQYDGWDYWATHHYSDSGLREAFNAGWNEAKRV